MTSFENPAPAAAPESAPPTLSMKRRLGQWLIPRLPMSRFAFEIFRVEVNAFLVRAGWRFLPWRRARLRRIRALRGVRANVASGGFLLDGFVHLDLFGGAPSVIRWDCNSGVPFADDSCKGIRVEHFVEHIDPQWDLPHFLADCRRALEPGGVLRVVVPDGERYAKAYAQAGLEGYKELGVPIPFPEDIPTRMDVLSHMFHQWHEHRWGYDFESLARRLKEAGFTRVEKMTYRNSLDPPLGQDREEHALYSLYADAVK